MRPGKLRVYRKERRILAIGAFPPPVTGQSKNLALIVDDIDAATGAHVERLNIAAGSVRKDLRYFLTKMGRVFRAVTTILRAPRYNSVVYLVSDGGFGQIYTIGMVLAGRLKRARIILQHRTFAYARRRSLLASFVNSLIYRDGVHVFLSEGMASAYFKNYSPAGRYVVNHNLAQFSDYWKQAREFDDRQCTARVRVGMLSNLMLAKGLDTFLEVVKLCRGLPIDFILAGPTPGEREAALVREAQRELGGSLTYIGAVSGAAKVGFYSELDIFLFPTRYPFEAQPNVVLEALCAGCWVIAPDRGCIADDLGSMGGGVIPANVAADPQAYVDQLRAALAQRDTLLSGERRGQTVARVEARMAEARSQYTSFLKLFC